MPTLRKALEQAPGGGEGGPGGSGEQAGDRHLGESGSEKQACVLSVLTGDPALTKRRALRGIPFCRRSFQWGRTTDRCVTPQSWGGMHPTHAHTPTCVRRRASSGGLPEGAVGTERLLAMGGSPNLPHPPPHPGQACTGRRPVGGGRFWTPSLRGGGVPQTPPIFVRPPPYLPPLQFRHLPKQAGGGVASPVSERPIGTLGPRGRRTAVRAPKRDRGPIPARQMNADQKQTQKPIRRTPGRRTGCLYSRERGARGSHFCRVGPWVSSHGVGMMCLLRGGNAPWPCAIDEHVWRGEKGGNRGAKISSTDSHSFHRTPNEWTLAICAEFCSCFVSHYAMCRASGSAPHSPYKQPMEKITCPDCRQRIA